MRVYFLSKSGSVLIEAMVGLSLIIISFGGILGLVSRGLQLNADTTNKFIATHLAAEGIEIIKSSLDANWNGVKPGMYELDYNCREIGKAPCINPNGGQNTRSSLKFQKSLDGVYSYSSGEETPFMRSVIVNVDGKTVTVNSIVQWANRGVTQKVQISDIFMKWRKDPNE